MSSNKTPPDAMALLVEHYHFKATAPERIAFMLGVVTGVEATTRQIAKRKR